MSYIFSDSWYEVWLFSDFNSSALIFCQSLWIKAATDLIIDESVPFFMLYRRQMGCCGAEYTEYSHDFQSN